MRSPLALIMTLAAMASGIRAEEDRKIARDLSDLRDPLALPPRGGGSRAWTKPGSPLRALYRVDRFGAADGGKAAKNAVRRLRQGRATVAQTRKAVKRAIRAQHAIPVRAAA